MLPWILNTVLCRGLCKKSHAYSSFTPLFQPFLLINLFIVIAQCPVQLNADCVDFTFSWFLFGVAYNKLLLCFCFCNVARARLRSRAYTAFVLLEANNIVEYKLPATEITKHALFVQKRENFSSRTMIYDYERSYFGCCSSGAIAQHTRNTYRKTHTVSHYCHCHKLWENMLTVYLMGCRYCNEIRLKLFYLFFLHLSTAVIVMASSDDFLSFYSIYFKRQVKRRHEYSSIKLFSFDFEMKTKIAIHLFCVYILNLIEQMCFFLQKNFSLFELKQSSAGSSLYTLDIIRLFNKFHVLMFEMRWNLAVAWLVPCNMFASKMC